MRPRRFHYPALAFAVSLLLTIQPAQAQRFAHSVEPPLADADGDVQQAQYTTGGGRSAVPSVSVFVDAPSFIQHGKELSYKLKVENVASLPAEEVEIRQTLPKGVGFKNSEPAAKATEPDIVWKLGVIKPGEKREIAITVVPTAEMSEFVHVVRVRFEHGRRAVTKIAKPEITLKKVVTKEAQQFDIVHVRLEVHNPTPLEVRDVTVTDALPEGLTHNYDPAAPGVKQDPRARTWTIERLLPNERRTFDYRMTADRPGAIAHVAVATATGGIRVESKAELTVQAPKLEFTATGPPKRAAHQPATYRVTVRNAGAQLMRNVTVTDKLPAQTEFVAATNGGQSFGGEVQWILPILQPGETRTLELTTKSPLGGKSTHQFAATYRGVKQVADVVTDFETAAALRLNLLGSPASVDVGGNVTFTIQIENSGSAPATNVGLKLTLPDELAYVSSEPVAHRPEGTRIGYDLGTLAVGGKQSITVTARGAKAVLSAVATAELIADQLESGPLKVQESTAVNRR